MSEQPRTIHRHPASGLLYVINGDEASIVGCMLHNQAHLDIPATITEGETPYRVTDIGEAAFSYMSALRTITLPPSLLSISHGAFEHSGLTEITLHDGLTSLAPYAFFGCVKLNKVVLPRSLTSLPAGCFGSCDVLTSGNVEGLERIPAANRSECGLTVNHILPEVPEYTRRHGFAPIQPPPAESAARTLLQQGQMLEADGQYPGAAMYYIQAHHLRKCAAAEADLPTRLESLNAIAEAEYRLGVLLKLGLAPIRNEDGSLRPTAAELLQAAADVGHIADAMYHLGDLYAGGYALKPDPAMALMYLKKAAAIGHERACLDLAYIYLDGTLDKVSADVALMYLHKCAAFDGPYAAIAREELTQVAGSDA